MEARGIRHVVVCGIATDYCVRATAMDALAYGFGVTVVKAAVRGVSVASISTALEEMAVAGVAFVESASDVELIPPP